MVKVAAALAAVGMLTATIAAADDYPNKSINLIVPYKPGGGSDTILRPTAMHLEDKLGQNVAVVNVAGAGGSIGWTQAAGAKPDGYNITMLTNALMVKEATSAANIKIEEFDPVANLGFVALTVTASAVGSYQNLKEYYEASQANPGGVGLAMGVGTPAQFVAAQVEEALGTDLKLVNAGGGADKKAAVLGGHVDALIEPVSGVVAQHEAGQLRILAVLSDERLSFLPDVPTAKEQGFYISAGLFYAIGVPQGTPDEVKAKLAEAIQGLEGDAEYREKLANIKFAWDYSDTDDTAALIDREQAATLELGKELGF